MFLKVRERTQITKNMVATGDKFNNNNQINNQIIKVKVG